MALQRLVDIFGEQAHPKVPTSGEWTVFISQLQHKIDRVLTAGTTGEMKRLNSDLRALISRMFAMMPKQVRDAALGDGDAAQESRLAYMMGEASFAQSLVAIVSHKSANEDLVQRVQALPYCRYIDLLSEDEKTNTDLARQMAGPGEEPYKADRVSRDLALLRDLGVTDVRRVGRQAYNFLTLLGREVYESINPAGSKLNPPAPSAFAAKLQKNTTELFREPKSFGRVAR